jgi:hypothetical protein
MPNTISTDIIASKILEIRGKKVMLDRELAKLYGVSTKVLNQAVKRNINRFPDDFMFKLTGVEKEKVVTICDYLENRNLRSQIVTSSWGGIRYLPYVFTEQGVAMLSSVLNSERAIRVNILIMRAFVKLREILLTHKDLAIKVEALERKYADHDEKIKMIFEAIKQLLQPPVKEKPRIGFHT